MSVQTHISLRQAIIHVQGSFGGVPPYVRLACVGGSDEHWQFFDPRDLNVPVRQEALGQEVPEVFPRYTLVPQGNHDLHHHVGNLEVHPDGGVQ